MSKDAKSPAMARIEALIERLFSRGDDDWRSTADRENRAEFRAALAALTAEHEAKTFKALSAEQAELAKLENSFYDIAEEKRQLKAALRRIVEAQDAEDALPFVCRSESTIRAAIHDGAVLIGMRAAKP